MKKLFCLNALLFFFLTGSAYAVEKERYFTDYYSEQAWVNRGAIVTYNVSNHDVKISRDRMRSSGSQGAAFMDLGRFDLSQDYHLVFDASDIDGFFAIVLHYAAMDPAGANSIEVQSKTDMEGSKDYDITQILSDNGISGKRQLGLEIVVMDDPLQDEVGTTVLNDLRLVSDLGFADTPDEEFQK